MSHHRITEERVSLMNELVSRRTTTLQTFDPGSYARKVPTANRWTLGPDPRAPSIRGGKLTTPGRINTDREAQ